MHAAVIMTPVELPKARHLLPKIQSGDTGTRSTAAFPKGVAARQPKYTEQDGHASYLDLAKVVRTLLYHHRLSPGRTFWDP